MNAFDALAETYDAEFTNRPIGRWLRAQVQARLRSLLNIGDTVLELGCGTGEDAQHLAEIGVHVTATDHSEAMLEEARHKASNCPRVSFQQLDLNYLPENWPVTEYHLAFSNFGALNCVRDRKALAEWLAQQLAPGGFAAFAVMAPYCLWEMFWHGLHLAPKTAFRRLRTQSFQPVASSNSLQVDYPSVARIRREFEPYFEFIRIRPLGFWLPPSDVYGVVEQRPRWMHTLLQLERSTANWGWLANFSDHYWIEFRRSDL